jgi:O-antigen biosynthesis protein
MTKKSSAKPSKAASDADARTSSDRKPSRWNGAIDGTHNNLVFGWAYDSEAPDARVVVELCLNGEGIGVVVADVARPDLAARFKNDICHGFVAETGNLINKVAGTLTARIANTGITLDGAIQLDAPKEPPVTITSQVMSDGALRLTGWITDATNPLRSVSVKALLGNIVVAETSANMQLPVTRALNLGAHGFMLDLPFSMADGAKHEVRVVDDKGRELNGSPLQVCCLASGAAKLLPSETPKLVSEAIDTYERYVPRSVSLRSYPEWAKAFAQTQNQDAGSESQPGKRKRIAVVIHGEHSAEQTLACLDQQQVDCEVFTLDYADRKPSTVHKLFKQVIAAKPDAITFVRAGDTLPAGALQRCFEGLQIPGAAIAYADSEILTQSGPVPWFKPAWNPEYAFATDFPLELMLVKTSLGKRLMKAVEFESIAHFQWRALAEVWAEPEAIIHVPRVLYRFETALGAEERKCRFNAATEVLSIVEPAARLENLNVSNLPADFTPRRLKRILGAHARKEKVSLIIPTRDRVGLLKRCITTIQQFTAWPNLEIIVVDNDSVEEETKGYFKYLKKQGVQILHVPGAFNFSKLNNLAVEAATGSIIGMINNDIEALHEGWLEEILSHLHSPGVGAVGAKLLWPNGMVQHGGVVMGVGSLAGHYGNLLADGDWGDHGRNQLTHRVSGVTAACLFMRKADFLSLGGMDEAAFPVAFNDVDLCLKVGAAGKAIVWTANAKLLHAESASRGHEDTPQKQARARREMEQLRKRWSETLMNDPHYHPSLNLDPHAQVFNGLALPPRDRSPRRAVIGQPQ